MRRPALLLDMDGTVIDSDPLHATVFVAFLKGHGITITEEEYAERFHGRRNEEIFAEILPGEDGAALDAAKEAAFRVALAGSDIGPVPGLIDLIDRVRRAGVATAIVTNGCKANAEAIIDRFDLAPRLDAVSLAEDVPRGKPDPAVYRHALDLLGATPEDALAFEDSPSGLAAARSAGLTTVGMATTLTPDRLRALGATLAISDFTDPALAPLIDGLISQGAAT